MPSKRNLTQALLFSFLPLCTSIPWSPELASPYALQATSLLAITGFFLLSTLNFDKITLNVSKVPFLMLCLVAAILFSLAKSNVAWHESVVWHTLCLIVLFYISFWITVRKTPLFQTVIFSTIFVACLQVFLQNLLNLSHPLLTGQTVGSTEVYTGFLALAAPLALGLSIHHRKTWRAGAYGLAWLTVMAGILLEFSRTGFLAALGSSAFITSVFVFSSIKATLKRFSLSTLTGAALLILAVAGVGLYKLYQHDTQSVQARLIGFQLMGNIFLESPFLGSGIGRFEHNYMTAQANYFADPEIVRDHRFVVGYRDHGDNEAIQILSEMGIIGGVLIFTFLTLSLHFIVKFYTSDRSSIPIEIFLLAGVLTSSIILSIGTSPLRFFPTATLSVCSAGVMLRLSNHQVYPVFWSRQATHP